MGLKHSMTVARAFRGLAGGLSGVPHAGNPTPCAFELALLCNKDAQSSVRTPRDGAASERPPVTPSLIPGKHSCLFADC